jgi:hypothetical protein
MPSHTHTRSIIFIADIFIFIILVLKGERKKGERRKNLFHFNLDANKLGKSLYYIRFIWKLLSIMLLLVLSLGVCVCANDGGFTQQNYEQNRREKKFFPSSLFWFSKQHST